MLRSTIKLILTFFIVIIAPDYLYSQEVCNDGIDNDGDGLIDCYDGDCYDSDECGFYDADYCRTILPNSKEFGMQLDNNFLAGNYQVQGTGPSYNYAPYGYDIPKVADLDNDGNMEIVTVSSRWGSNGIFIFDPIKSELKYFIPLTLSDNHTGVTLGNIDSDPFVEIIVATGYEGTGNSSIYRFDFDGINWNEYTIGSWPITNAFTRRGFQPDLFDFNEDGTPEMIFYGESYGGKTAKIYRLSDGAELVDIIAQTGGATGHVASHLYWKDHYAVADVIPSGFDPGSGALSYADGLEFIVGTRVYTIDIDGGNVEDVWGNDPVGVHAPWVYGAGGDGDAGQKVALADINVDGDLDIVVTGQGRISIWDPLTNSSICNTKTLGGGWKGGIACIGDVDGDANGQPEIGVVSSKYVEVFRYNTSNQLEQVWGLSNTDVSGETACNFFDFEGDGSVEMVYRDQTDLWVYEGEGDGNGAPAVLLTSNQAYNDANGLITNVDGCSSNTGSEHPIIVDVDQNNRADIVVSCSEGLRVYRDRYTPWISSRGIFNQRSYSFVNLNEDMTIPAVMQKNHIVPSLNNYLTQMYRIDKAGNPFYPAPDFTIEVKSIDNPCHGVALDEVDFVLNIFNYGDGHADDFEVPITFYDGDPAVPGARILKQQIVNVNLYPLNAKETHVFNIKMSDLDNEGDGLDGDIYVTINDKVDSAAVVDGGGFTTVATTLPNSPYPECNYANNTIGPFIFRDCVSKSPSISLDENSSSHGGTLHYTDYSANYTESSGKVSVSDIDVKISDDGSDIASAEIELYNPFDGEAYEGLYWDASALSALGINTTASQGDISVILTGTQPIAAYEAAIELFQYENTSDIPNLDDRLVVVSVTDANDGLTSGSAVCYFNINGVNDAPLSADTTVTTNESKDYVFTGNEISYSDPDGDPAVSVQITTLPAKGTLYNDANLNGVYDVGEELTVLDELTLLELYAGRLAYKPIANEYGSVNDDYIYTAFTFKVSDGLSFSALAYTCLIKVHPVNVAPTASDNNIELPEDTQHTFSATEFNFADVDPGNELYKVQLMSTPAKGVLYNDVNTNGTYDEGEKIAPYDEILKTAIDNNQMIFEPGLNGNGSPYAFFNFKVHDIIEYSVASYKMTINITPLGDNPVISDSTFSVDENSANNDVIYDVNDSLSFTDVDIDNEVLNYSIIAGNNAGVFTIDAATGIITVLDNTNLNYEANQQFVLTVHASDGTNSDDGVITINVNDIIEKSFFTIDAIGDITVNENTPYTSVTPKIINDTPIGTVTYTLGGTDAADFTIDANTGVVSMVGRDFENPVDANTDNVYELTITATDADGNSDTEDWTVTVDDVVETASFTIDAISNVNINENTPYTSVTPSITGMPIDTLAYTLGGADAADFTIDANTGVVSMVGRDFENPVDANTDNVYELTITATDADGNSDTEDWTVTVDDVVETASFTIDAISNVNINENTAYTSVTPNITGTPIGSVTYTIGGADAADFTIDANTGVVSMVGRDFENPVDANTDNVYELTITATDADGNSDTEDWTVTVDDVVETASFTIDAISNVNINENTAYTSVTPNITGTPIGSMTYTIGGADAADFTIDANTGVVSMVGRDFENPLDANTDNVYELTITATDADGNSDTEDWTVTVDDVVETASFTIDAISNVNINENTAYTSVTPNITGTPIGSMTYTIGGADAADFTIDANTGVVSMVGRDFENPLDANTDNVYELTITATDADGNSDTEDWTVTVDDVVETASFTIDAISNVNINENTAYTSVTPNITGTPIGSMTYTIGGADAADFTIDANTGVVSMVGRDFENPLDANTDNVYELTITATDADGNSDTEDWTVTVDDVVETASFTIDAISNVNINENTVYTSVTPNITGTPIGSVTYTIGGADAADFTIDANTGVVSMVGRDFENPVDANTDNVYELTITARDADDNTATEDWTVTIENVSETASFTIDAISNVNINENTVYTSVTPNITGTPIGSVTYTIGGADAADFTIDANTGVVSMVGRDFENPVDANTDNVYELTITARDADDNTATEDWTVTIENVSETASFTIDAISNVNINENTAYTSVTPNITGTPIGSMTYTIGGADAADFTIDANTGVVSMVGRDFENPVDANTDNVYELTITARDADDNTATEDWTVTIENVSETASFTIDAISNVNINENTVYTSVTPNITGTPIGSVTYTIGGADAADFTIDANTGVVSMVGRDFENPVDANTDNVYELTITARDADDNTATEDWTVTIENVSETASFTIDAISNVNINENTAYTSVTPNITGTPIGSVTYTIGGADAADFTIDANTGVVSMVGRDFENPVDANTDNVYELTITARDADDNTATEDWTVTIENVSETASFTIDAISNVNINENTAYTSITPNITGTPIGSVTYTIGGADAADFTIDANTGVVSMVARDYENPEDANTDNVYELTITARDADDNTATEDWTVTIENVSETASFTIDAISNVNINENTVYTSVTPNITGTPIGSVTYTIGGADAADFTIDAVTGVVSMVARDYENPEDANTDNVYELTITARDTDGNTATEDWTVTIDNVNEAEPNQKPIAAADNITITAGGKATGNLLANDSDPDGDNLIINITPISNPTNGAVVINANGTFVYTPSTGFVGTDSFVYQVCDDGTPSECASATVTITVNASDKDKDTDNDGIPDSVEGNDDPDNDGIPSSEDLDSDGDGIPDAVEGIIDTDGDGTPDYKDEDSDNDGISDAVEGSNDTDDDGIPDYKDTDSDGDGISDSEEGTEDIDGDGYENFRDTDSDDDGILDGDELKGDCDNDGIQNPYDADPCREGSIFIPEGFSPNNDGDNDLFVIPEIEQYEHVTIKIYNRWGNIIFEQENYENGWDGTSNVKLSLGDELPTGTYFYQLEIHDTGERLTGYVYLNR